MRIGEIFKFGQRFVEVQVHETGGDVDVSTTLIPVTPRVWLAS
jgi:hypothetical protein